MEASDWALVLAFTRSGRLLLVNQYRFGSRALSWEPPGGVLDPDEKDPVAAGLRELKEETGYSGSRARQIGWVYPNPAIQNNRAHFILVEDCAQVSEPSPDAHEELVCREVTFEKALKMTQTGEISHAIAHAALLALLADRQWQGPSSSISPDQ